MPRVSKLTKDLAAKHSKTMLACPIFPLWAHRHLVWRGRVDEYRKAWEYLHSNAPEEELIDEQSPTRLEPADA